MSLLIYGIIGFTILCGATAVAYALPRQRRGEDRMAPDWWRDQ